MIGKQAINSAVARWQPTLPLVVAPPGSRQFLPVLEVAQFAHKAHSSARRRGLRLAIGVFLLFVISVGLSIFQRHSLDVVLTLMAVSAYLFAEHRLVTSNEQCLAERARFFVWAYDTGRTYFLCWLSFTLILGMCQYTLSMMAGGNDTLLLRFGTLYRAVHDGDWWRIATGPLLHAGAVHWIVNGTLLVIVSSVVGALSRCAVVWAFVVGNVVAALAALSINQLVSTGAEGYIGMSGGVFAVLGCGVGLSIRRSTEVPCRLCFTLLSFAVMAAFASWISQPGTTSLVAHIAGFCVGTVVGLTLEWNLQTVDKAQR